MKSAQGSSISESSERSTKYNMILLLDDNSLDNVVNQKLIEMNKVANQVLTHQTAQATIAYLNDASDEDLPDIIFLDILMPEMDGFQFLEEFQKMSTRIHK
ncbi:MAG: response regulator, partial [Bacteroidia bacterium]|nr:response regulator [Bacteroidia bacterium]